MTSRVMRLLAILLLLGLASASIPREIKRKLIPKSAALLASEQQQQTAETATSALFDAIRSGNLAAFHTALRDGASVSGEDDRDLCSPLMVASMNGQVEMAQTLLDKGADPTKRCRSGYDPMHGALLGAHTDIVLMLLKNGASPLALSPDHFTPIHRAAMSSRPEHLAILEHLLTYAARNPTYNRAIQSAQIQHKITGSSPLHTALESKNLPAFALLLQYGLSPNVFDQRGNTPLHLATASGNHEAVKLLLQHKNINVRVLNRRGQSPLDLAKQGAVQTQTQTSPFHSIHTLLTAKGAVSGRDLPGFSDSAEQAEPPTIFGFISAVGENLFAWTTAASRNF